MRAINGPRNALGGHDAAGAAFAGSQVLPERIFAGAPAEPQGDFAGRRAVPLRRVEKGESLKTTMNHTPKNKARERTYRRPMAVERV